ncbi:MAG: thiolase family protein [Flavobacteriales bacterium]|nr:thiolase family protein [Flavobacteriales bacterium]MCW8911851.1 thiolase family protein [Flavobacteriales bacterium]MCW8936378.1 thiolase family protein [Flavobacteriales bacterium]MCW8968314.1 thiolase family protein [Flavobacteriales bacterium]MCW8990852.1 thiolase family protein [Flavobacteriales bacterium]
MKGFYDKKKGIGITYDNIYLVNGARTPFGKLCGTLGQVSPTDLGIYATKAAIEKSGISGDDIDQVMYANIGQSSADSYFLPRHIGLFSGIPESVPAVMLQRICGSGFETIIAGAEQISLGKAQTALCGGTENMTLSPTVSFGNRMGYPLGKIDFKDMLWEALNDTAAVPMGCTAENVAAKHGITKNDANEFAKLSVDRYLAAKERGFFDGEIIKMNSAEFAIEGLNTRKVKLPRNAVDFNVDENVRPSDLEAMSKLPSVFARDGVQTAANSSGIVDGAASVVVASGDFIKEKGLKPLTRVVASATSALDPRVMGLGPVPAIKLVLELAGLTLADIGLVEINEAFAAQFIGCEKELGLNRDICNVNGGAIALGHPLAATGTRLSLTLSREMQARGVKYGIASACIGGGQGTAILFENMNA